MQHAEPAGERAGVNLDGRQAFGQRAFLEGFARGLLRGFSAAARPWTIAVASVASTFLASLISAP